MLKALFGKKKRSGKSVNEVRGRKGAKSKKPPTGPEPGLEARIQARRAKTKRMADIRAQMAKAGHFERPDIAGAVDVAKSVTAEEGGEDQAVVIERALRLKGSARVIDETLAHPSWRYVALAIVRGLLEEREREPKKGSGTGPKAQKTARKG